MKKRLFSFSYYIRKQKDRKLRPHQLRDGTAFAELVAFYTERGYEYSGPLLNYPSKDPLEIDVSFLTSSDLLVLPTRPPLDDRRKKDKKQVEPSNTSLEKIVFEKMRAYFEICARSHVRLTESLARQLSTEYANRAEIQFMQHLGPWYREYRAYDELRWEPHESKRKKTAAYLVHVRRLWEDGPALLAAFGMSGIETLVWTCLLRREFPHLLEAPVFAMAELEARPIPARPTTIDFVKDWKAELLIEYPLT